MLYTVSELSNLIGVSKVSIYNKLKLAEFNKYILKNKGITYIDDAAVNLIKDSLNLKKSIESDLIYKDISTYENELDQQNNDILNFKDEYIIALKNENQKLWDQLNEKDSQIQELINLNKNNQILLKQEHDKKIYFLEEHFNEVDQKLIDIRMKMDKKKKHIFFK